MTDTTLRRTRAGIAALLVTMIATVLVPVESAHAAETYPRPADGTFVLEGHGYGHGTGMSQWGAQGAAKAGLAYPQILGHYYPGTTLTTGGPGSLRVWLTADSGHLWVRPSAGLAVTIGTATTTLPGTGYSSWRVRLAAGQHHVEGFSGGAWRPFRISAGPVTFTNTAKMLRLILSGGVERDYRGSLQAVASGGLLRTVNVVTMQNYLKSVVPAEVFPSWRPAALQAQAVAARTYAAYEARSRSSFYDVCDTTSCQVYKGAANEVASTNAAVDATAGRILTYGGLPAFTQFSASNGGYSTAGSFPYLPARADPYDAAGGENTNHTWTASLRASVIETTYPQVGSVRALRVLSRDGRGEWGGRINQIAIDGSQGSVTVTGTAFRSAFGLRSHWFRAATVSCPVVTRLFGQTRFATSVVEGRAAFPTSDAVVIVSADPAHLADGVVAAPFAFALGAPVLLTERHALPTVVADDIADRGVSTAYIIGGTIPISPSVDAQLASLGVTTIRLAGGTRYQTAAKVANEMGVTPSAAVIASGDAHHLIDALVAGGPAARQGWPILLTRRGDVPGETRAALEQLGVSKTYVIGGTIPITDDVVAWLSADGRGPQRLAGGTVYTTAVAVADEFAAIVGTGRTLVASGERTNIIDALGGGTFGRIIVLSGHDALPSATAGWLRGHGPYTQVTVVGGTLAVSDQAYRAVEAAVCG